MAEKTSRAKFEMKQIRILVDSLADQDLTNAQMVNAREIVSRLDSERFSVTMFTHGSPAAEIKTRPATRLIQLPDRRQTLPILSEFIFGRHNILFYLKASPASLWYMRLRSLRPGRCKVLGTIESQTDWRDETITPQAIRLVERTILKCDYLFSNSQFVRRSLEMNYGLDSEVVPTGVDLSFFAPCRDRATNPRPRVLFVGALRKFKGPHVVLDAAERYPQADFVMVGAGILDQELRQRSKALPNVTMRGALGQSELRKEFHSADIFLFPSQWEGSPKVLMEAAACGLPIVARKDFEPESVVDGKTGFLAATNDEILERLGQLLAAPALCRTFGEAGRTHVTRFSWDRITREWEDIFMRVAPGSARGSQS